MNSTKFVVTLVLCLMASTVDSQVYISEAAKKSGDHAANRTVYSMWYTGACAERVGVSILYAGLKSLDNALIDVRKYARDAAKYVVAKCPAVQTIEANARHARQILSPIFYRFEMNRSDDWASSNVEHSDAIINDLIASGYVPVRGPRPLFSTAFINFSDATLDVVYGLQLEGRMSAREVLAQKNEDTGQVSHYIIRGDWYDLGSEQPNGQCDKSRNGYPLWGSFSMTVHPSGSNLGVTRKRCTGQDGAVKSEVASFVDLNRSKYKAFGLQPVKIARELGKRIAASNTAVDGVDSKQFARERKTLFDNNNVRVFARRPDLCSHLDFDVVYRINNERRDSAFGGNYTQAIANIVRQVASEHCSDPNGASIDSYSQGDEVRWDHMSFRFKPNHQGIVNDGNYLKRTVHIKSSRAKAHGAWLLANLLGPACSDAPFCDLPGGRYLNAIYRGDLESVRQMDHLYKTSVQQYVNQQRPDSPAVNTVFGAAFKTENVQLLRDAANKYLYSYPAWGDGCLVVGAQAKTYEHTTPLVIETNGYGITTRSGGEKFSATYTVNPEFFGLRDILGSYKGARDSDHPSNLPEKVAVYRGIVEMKLTLGCNSAEVKQFERKLLELTKRVLAEPGTIPPSIANQPPLPSKVVSKPFAQMPEEASRNAQSVTVPVSVKKIASMTPQERQQAMAAELKELHERMDAKAKALSEMFEGVPAETQSKLINEYREKLLALQQQMQKDVTNIQSKYR